MPTQPVRTVNREVSGTSPAAPGLAEIAKVLIVDDSRLQRRILSGALSAWGLEVLEAGNGDEALALSQAERPDLILSDWLMPGMDGPTFCRAYRDLGLERYAYFILLTSKGEKSDIAHGLQSGADDFLTKPFDREELRARIVAGDRLLALHGELERKNARIADTLERLRAAHEALDRDVANARKIQQALIPRTTQEFGDSRVSLLLRPCGHVGGDLVGMFSPGWPMVGFFSADVSGHGITSAMMTARLAGHLSARYPAFNVAMRRIGEGFYALRPPDEVAAELNARFTIDDGIEEYLTMAYAVVDQSSGRLDLVQAGHPPPLVLRRDGTAEFLGAGGFPIGLFPRARYARVSTRLSPGDRVLLYSDGFTECRTPSGELLGQEGLLRLARRALEAAEGRAALEALRKALCDTVGQGATLEDDLSAALLEFRTLRH